MNSPLLTFKDQIARLPSSPFDDTPMEKWFRSWITPLLEERFTLEEQVEEILSKCTSIPPFERELLQ
jgi:hypothetical protein